MKDMIDRFLIIICFNSRKITTWIIGIYFIVMIFLKSSLENTIIKKFELPIFYLLIGFYIGINLMAWIIKFLNKEEVKNNPTFQRLKNNEQLKKKTFL